MYGIFDYPQAPPPPQLPVEDERVLALSPTASLHLVFTRDLTSYRTNKENHRQARLSAVVGCSVCESAKETLTGVVQCVTIDALCFLASFSITAFEFSHALRKIVNPFDQP